MTGCGCTPKKKTRPYKTPSLQQLLDHLDNQRKAASSFQAESVMDYWLGKDRVKGKVYVMGKTGAYARFNALNPTGDDVAVDMACDGTQFKYVDKNNDCQLTGACNSRAIAALLGVELEPDDFLLLAVGTVPVIEHASGKNTWDSDGGYEVIELVGKDGRKQIIKMRGTPGKWDVVSAKVIDAKGKTDWKLVNKSFKNLEGVDGKVFRAPSKSRFEQPKQKADLIVKWVERKVNLPLGPEKWALELPGVKTCGSK